LAVLPPGPAIAGRGARRADARRRHGRGCCDRTDRAAAPAGGRAGATDRTCHDAPADPGRTFDKPPAKGVERAKIGYRRVRISSKPDSVRSVERGRLERGDEVEILDSYEGYLEIRTPDGITGWILRHTIISA
jgi:hypothetical protein